MQFLERKLSIPPVPSFLVSRPRLLDRLDQWVRKNLTLILAPAGSGKTTLLCDWVVRRPGKARVVWVSLGREDNDFRRFWQYIVAAIKPMATKSLTGWMQESVDPTVEEIERLINWVQRHVKHDFLLVLDDYHAITSSEINDAVAYLLDYLPPNMHVAIVSRSLPALPIAQIRVRNQLLEFSKDDLKFSGEEAGLFFRSFGLGQLLPDEIEHLNSRTEGWAVGLQIAAISLRDTATDRSQKLSECFSGAYHFIDEYFLEQIFRGQNRDIQEFLLSTSILERFNASICSEVAETTDSRRILDQLERDGLFLVRLDNTREWYRYHQLFADFLANKLRRDYADRYPLLHTRAAQWLERMGQEESAMEHALLADNSDLANRIIEKIEKRLWGRNEIKTLDRWFKTLPADFVRSKTSLYCGTAWAVALSDDLEKLLPYMLDIEFEGNNSGYEKSRAEQGANTDENTAPVGCSSTTYQCYDSLLRAYHALYQGRMQESWPLLQHALEVLSGNDLCWERAVVLYYTGQYLFWNNELEQAIKVFTNAADVSRRLGHHIVHISSLSGIAASYVVQGKLSLAEEYYQRSFDYLAGVDIEIYTAGNYFGLNDVRLLRNEVDEAARDADHYFSLSESSGRTIDLIGAHVGRSKLRWVLGDSEGAWEHLRSARHLAVQRNVHLYDEFIQLLQVRLGLRIGEPNVVSRWAEGYMNDSRVNAPHLKELSDLTFARYLLAHDRGTAAIELLEQILKNSRAGGRAGIALEALVLLALAHQESGKHEQGHVFLEELLRMAQPEGIVRPFVDEGERMRTLLQGITRRNPRLYSDLPMRRFIDMVVRAFENPPSQGMGRQEQGPNRKRDPLVESLSKREIQVIKMISEGMTYEQVAGELVVALSTVQWHIKNIYRKLQVHSGLEAIAIVRELGLLQ
jgi:LuxR family transcriptional regulator, maltose regulon positive regulatory protein